MRSRPAVVFAPLALASAIAGSQALSCPAFVEAGQLGGGVGGARSDLRLFTIAGDNGKRTWVSQPLQVDPMEVGMGGQGVLAVPEEGAKPDAEPLKPLDRIAFRIDGFGAVRVAADPAPCKTTRLFEVQNPADPARFAYLAACDDPTGATRSKEPNPVTLDAAKQNIKSPVFDYTYLASNQLLFSKLGVRDKATGKLVDTGADSDILLHLDLTKFFTMDLTNDNVQSFVEGTRAGQLGVVERLQFYLKLLVFKIDLKMATTASFFADSANLPMVMDIPLDPASNLNAGSGMLFNWLPKAATLLPLAPGTTALAADPKRLAAGPKALAAEGLKRCKSSAGGMCTYTLQGEVGAGAVKETFFIDMVVPRYLVEAGFYPMYVEDLGEFKKAMDWDGDDTDKKRIAMYFEVSGLPKGQHKMDYWIRLGADTGACPAPVNVRGAVALSAPALAH